MRKECVDTLVIGGGQAGLAMSHMLARRGLAHLVLERDSIAVRWRSERWLGLRFQFPNWSIRLPEFPFACRDPDGFASAEEIHDYLVAYAAFVAPPVRCGVAVESLSRGQEGEDFVAWTPEGPIEARNVVVAVGPYQKPVVPPIAGQLDVFQLHASRYRSPDDLPEGGVLVVGSGASGAQIAEELIRAGRAVHLSISRHRRMPRRYRGRDLMWWLHELGLDRLTPEQRGPDPGLPLITGAHGGHTIDFRNFARQGIVMAGRVIGAEGARIGFADDLQASVGHGDAAYLAFLDRVDAHVRDRGLAMPSDPEARSFLRNPNTLPNGLMQLDLSQQGIGAIIWATGYATDFGWIQLPVFDSRGHPVHKAGVTAEAGLYFLGLPWLSRMTSSFLSGVGEDAEYLADHIATRSMGNR